MVVTGRLNFQLCDVNVIQLSFKTPPRTNKSHYNKHGQLPYNKVASC